MTPERRRPWWADASLVFAFVVFGVPAITALAYLAVAAAGGTR